MVIEQLMHEMDIANVWMVILDIEINVFLCIHTAKIYMDIMQRMIVYIILVNVIIDMWCMNDNA